VSWVAKQSELQVQIQLDSDLKRKADALKKYYNVQNNTELIKILVNEKAQQLNAHPMEATPNANK
jgi:hypothetical protein